MSNPNSEVKINISIIDYSQTFCVNRPADGSSPVPNAFVCIDLDTIPVYSAEILDDASDMRLTEECIEYITDVIRITEGVLSSIDKAVCIQLKNSIEYVKKAWMFDINIRRYLKNREKDERIRLTADTNTNLKKDLELRVFEKMKQIFGGYKHPVYLQVFKYA